MVTFTWEINPNSLFVENKNGNPDTVVLVIFTIKASDGIYNAEHSDMVRFEYDPSAPFIPFASLTKDQVIEWVKNSLPKDKIQAYESMLTERIDSLANPPARPVVKVAPWTACSSAK